MAKAFIGVLLLMLWTHAQAVTVIATHEPVFPLASPLQSFSSQNNVVETPQPSPPDITSLIAFPIETRNLEVGEVATRKAHFPDLAQPFFVLGSDIRSQTWLAHYTKRLQSLHAVGFLVQVRSYTELQKMQTLAQGIPLLPTAGEELAKRFGITHYPVLIANGVIEQ